MTYTLQHLIDSNLSVFTSLDDKLKSCVDDNMHDCACDVSDNIHAFDFYTDIYLSKFMPLNCYSNDEIILFKKLVISELEYLSQFSEFSYLTHDQIKYLKNQIETKTKKGE